MSITSLLKSIFRPGYYSVLPVISRIKLKLSPPKVYQLEIGAGASKRQDWLTLDMCRGADIYWDLRKKMPFQDSIFERVYCSHVLEHFSYPELKLLLLEILRILRPGGEFSIVVPDASLYVDAYINRENTETLLRYKPAVVSSKPMDILNYMFYMEGHHKFMFDEENLTYHCEETGFTDCKLRSFDPIIDMESRDYESLYMQCIKPEI